LDSLEEELLSLLATFNPSKPAATAPKAAEEHEEEQPHEDGWMEVGKRNKMLVTRTVGFGLGFGASTVAHATDCQQVKSNESPITRIFGGKFRSTLRAPHQRDSVMVEDWRALQLDIQVCVAA